MIKGTANQVLTRPLRVYFSVAKPATILPHLITATAAMFLAVGGIPPVMLVVYTLLGGGLVAAAANTLNSYLDRDIDALMERTRNRPIPSGQIEPFQVLILGAAYGVTGVLILLAFVNYIAALLAVLALVYYIIPYTLLLKRRTYWSSIIGSGIGAIPPLIGWVAAANRVELTPLLLSLIIVLWTIPHFWGLALFRRNDYEHARLKMLPSKGVVPCILTCSLLLVSIPLFLVLSADLGTFFLVITSLSGIGLLYLTFNVRKHDKAPLIASRSLYLYSNFYIVILFGAMIIDRIIT